ncbi:uncharacterized protein L201_000404 [Kwoniella dendrophila CBS 6074]|uniref:FHA domain-containing protein n=1 Tax=Kwoniella dendrophila CBS 6074 TaxID=1295534 RepID=A0AAX4JJG4_9TREE
MAEWDRDGSPMPTGPPPVTLGRLTLMKRKGGGDVQTIPLDAERITFGRDYDCDVRLYYSDVSKLHCEILFDSMTGGATLHVRGTNGLLHTPSGSSATSYKPPAEITLSDNDVITIRKKPFRFQYGPAETVHNIPYSPAVHASASTETMPSLVKQPSFSSPSSQPVRRRASHRLSLVPEGKTFVPLSPMKNRRHSTLGLGGMGTPAKSTGRSKLSEEIPREEEEEQEQEQAEIAEELVLDVANGDEGDKVYLEVNEENLDEEEVDNVKTKPIHNNPFMTPQQTRRAPLRNTSAVARTRNQANTKLLKELSQAEQKAPSTSPVSKDSPTPATPPKTPRSVPLPTASDTPYNPPTTPAAQKVNNTPVPARVALSTPKGPATLRKALLLRSARKVWQESRAAGVEGAIEAGSVETRRKSTSPRDRAGRKSITPAPAHDEDEEMSDEEDVQEEQIKSENGTLEWVHEDGTAEVSFESDSSGHDSLEADVSLDIPGQGVIEFAMSNPEVEEEYINNDRPLEEEEEEEFEESELDIQENDNEAEEEYEEYEQAINLPADDSIEEVKASDLDQEEEEEQVEEDEAMSLPGTPQARQPLSSQFFTPQPARNIHKLPRRSLASIGGPPVRFERLPATPSSFRAERAPPGSMGKPSRRITLAVPKVEDEDTKVEEPIVEKKGFATPVKSEAARAEAKRRRESLATPRQLPAMPASGFKNPVVETRFPKLVASRSHPALQAESPESSHQHNEVPSTPINDLKQRLDQMRQQSAQRADRRATVGFVLPSTPSRPEMRESGSWSVNPRRIEGKGPKTPIFPKFKKEEQIIESPSEDATSTSQHNSPLFEAQHKAPPQAPSSPEYETPSSPSTPSYTGLKEMLKPSLPTKTPDMSGLKTLFPSTPKEIASPSLVGVRELLREPPTIPATPNFTGMKDMFKQPKIAQTPGFEGIDMMFAEEQEEEEEQEEIEAAEDAISVVDVAEEKEKELAPYQPVKEVIEIHDETLDAIVVQSESETEEVETVEEKKNVPVKSKAVSKLPRPATTTSTSTSISAPTRTRRAAPSATSSTTPASAPTKTASRLPARRTAAATNTVVVTEKPSRGKRVIQPATAATKVEQPEEPKSRSTRSKRTASIDPEPASAPSRTTRARSRTVEPEEKSQNSIPEEINVKPTRSRSTSTRTTRQATAEIEEDEKPSKPSRSKKPLTQLPEQPIEEEMEKKTASRTVTKSKLPTATSTSTIGKRVTSNSGKSDDKSTAASRRKVAVGNKENDESATEEKPTTVAKKRVVSSSSSTSTKASGVPVPVARATRSRK